MAKDEFETVLDAISSKVECQMTKKGLLMRPVGQSTLERLIEVPVNVQGKVWDWLHGPREIYAKEECDQI